MQNHVEDLATSLCPPPTIYDVLEAIVLELRPTIVLLEHGVHGKRNEDKTCVLDFVYDEMLPRIGEYVARAFSFDPEGEILEALEQVNLSHAALAGALVSRPELQGAPPDWTAATALTQFKRQFTAIRALTTGPRMV